MHDGTETQERNHSDLQSEVEVANVADLRKTRQGSNVAVAAGYLDVSACLPNGLLYIQAAFPHILHQIAESVPDGIVCVEVRVSTARRGTLPPAGTGRTISGSWVAITGLVPDRRKR